MSVRSGLAPEYFDEHYYSCCCGRPYRRDQVWWEFFGRIADTIVATIAPARVLDAGCALGFMVERLRDRNIEAYGFDVSPYAISRVPERLRSCYWVASVCDEIDGRYDLIVCQEVFPHLTPEEGEAAIENFCRHTNDVLFSSSPSDPAAPQHLNRYGPEDWAAIFAHCGFYRDRAYDASFVTPWAVRYRRSGETLPEIVAGYERKIHALHGERDEARRHGAAPLEADLAATRQALVEARDRIHHMERSWFWRARGIWARLSGR